MQITLAYTGFHQCLYEKIINGFCHVAFVFHFFGHFDIIFSREFIINRDSPKTNCTLNTF
jgi:hypothetical protein